MTRGAQTSHKLKTVYIYIRSWDRKQRVADRPNLKTL